MKVRVCRSVAGQRPVAPRFFALPSLSLSHGLLLRGEGFLHINPQKRAKRAFHNTRSLTRGVVWGVFGFCSDSGATAVGAIRPHSAAEGFAASLQLTNVARDRHVLIFFTHTLSCP